MTPLRRLKVCLRHISTIPVTPVSRSLSYHHRNNPSNPSNPRLSMSSSIHSSSSPLTPNPTSANNLDNPTVIDNSSGFSSELVGEGRGPYNPSNPTNPDDPVNGSVAPCWFSTIQKAIKTSRSMRGGNYVRITPVTVVTVVTLVTLVTMLLLCMYVYIFRCRSPLLIHRRVGRPVVRWFSAAF